MTDPRLKQLAHNLINFSTNLQKGEKILIEVFDADEVVAEELVKAVYEAGGIPFVQMHHPKVLYQILKDATKEQIEDMTRYDTARMQDMQAYISFRGNNNASENANLPLDKLNLYQSIYMKQVHTELRVRKTKWVVLRYPNSAMAQLAGMSTRDFEDFYFDVCNLDYAKMEDAMTPLVERIERTDRVKIVARDTDIEFSIKGIGAKKCAGHMNIPDGEVYTAPVRDSVNGVITYNTPSTMQGFTHTNVKLTVKDGKIIDAVSNDIERITKIFDTDEGARYFGEFALGVNPFITRPMNDILFDEKISGSIHFTPGSSYDDADNGNRSAVHWDLVQIQTPEYGGGEIYFDGELIRKNGIFTVPDLLCLNPENLV